MATDLIGMIVITDNKLSEKAAANAGFDTH